MASRQVLFAGMKFAEPPGNCRFDRRSSMEGEVRALCAGYLEHRDGGSRVGTVTRTPSVEPED